jgi:hypothetical protein
MVDVTLLASTALMGALLVGTAVVLASRGSPRSYAVPVGGDRSLGASVGRAAESPTTWVVAFLAVTGAALAGTVLYITETSLPAGVGIALLGTVAGGVVVYFAWGFYHATRHRGLQTPAALAAAAWAFGMLFLLVVVLRLLEMV